MSDCHQLKGLSLVITRPLLQAKGLNSKLKGVGASTTLFPLLEISPPDDVAVVANKLKKLAEYDLLIFVSTNAVEQTMSLIGPEFFLSLRVASTGKKTALKLEEYGLTVDFVPDKKFNSESLLAIPEFQNFINSKKIAIIRGGSGRKILRNALVDYAESVDYINVYKRTCPQKNLSLLGERWKQGKLDVIVFTSGTSISNFFKLSNGESWINKITFLVGSDRMKQKLPCSFKGKLLIAEDPSDETLYKKIITLYG